ncbi:MAG: D-alanine--D-alanine ligase [Thiotrichaceae bacterium]|nr:D-alanine--D-alanine ligase [Thiotrichaceae bacterium]PCI10624.1 MAG: D-alanine--D-alanine ligase [Thiotrichales bacterium]PCI11927.1 MAG: D-alanine--D-alanine ligase [Thiotrichales bacterium]
MHRIEQAAHFGKVAVLMGGHSSEREISLNSGDAVLQSLLRSGVDAHAVDPSKEDLLQIRQSGFDRALIILHGRGGEDGVIQGALEAIGLPYTGTGVMGSALGMDKLRTKQLWQGAGLFTPAYQVLNSACDFVEASREIGLPMIVKPATEGSSIGMSKVIKAEDLSLAWQKAAACDATVLAERWIDGAEYTVAILQDEALPLIRVETARDFYDFEAKYQSDDTAYICPCGLSAEQENALQQFALKAFDVVGCRGWGRVDLMCDQQNKAWLIEVNTVPGMTDHSLVPMAAKAAGIGFDQLVWRILETSVMTEDDPDGE